MSNILKADNTILRTGTNVFITGQEPVPVLDLDAESLLGEEGEPISVWPEPNGNNAFQYVATRQPVLETAHGKKSVRFDIDDFMLFSSGWVTRTVFFVVERISTSTTVTPLLSGNVQDFNSNQYLDGGSDGDTWFRNTPNFFGTSTVDRLFTNGNRVNPTFAQIRLQTPHILCLDIASRLIITTHLNFRTTGESPSVNMRLYRIVAYDKRLTDTDRNAITAQLRNRYGI